MRGAAGNSINSSNGTGKTDGISRSKAISIFLLVLALPLIWRWTPLHDWVNFQQILEWQGSVKNDPAAPFYVLGAYLVGSLFFFPVTILNLATVFAFGPIWGNVYAFAGWLLSASQGYFIGHVIGREALHKVAGNKLSQLIDRAQRHGFWTVLAMRIVPIGPFSLVNLFIGASGIDFRDFLFASAVGRLPGVLTLTLFGVQLQNLLRRPGLTSFALLMFILIVVPLAISRLLKRFDDRPVP